MFSIGPDFWCNEGYLRHVSEWPVSFKIAGLGASRMRSQKEDNTLQATLKLFVKQCYIFQGYTYEGIHSTAFIPSFGHTSFISFPHFSLSQFFSSASSSLTRMNAGMLKNEGVPTWAHWSQVAFSWNIKMHTAKNHCTSCCGLEDCMHFAFDYGQQKVPIPAIKKLPAVF